MAAWFILLIMPITHPYLNAKIIALRQSNMSSKHYMYINNKNYIKRFKQQTELS